MEEGGGAGMVCSVVGRGAVGLLGGLLSSLKPVV